MVYDLHLVIFPLFSYFHKNNHNQYVDFHLLLQLQLDILNLREEHRASRVGFSLKSIQEIKIETVGEKPALNAPLQKFEIELSAKYIATLK